MKLPETELVNEIRYSGIAVNKVEYEKLYTEAQLKQAVRDALEAAAKVCISVSEKNESKGMYLWEARKSAEVIRNMAKEIV